jgi:histidyl-tRNA synthetase
VPAIGFAFGYSTTRELLVREGAWPAEEITTDVYVAPVSESVSATATEIAGDLRDAGLVVETNLADRPLGNQFSYADSINASYVVVVGERDLEDGEVTLRDMDSGEETNVPLEECPGAVVERLEG